MSRESKGVVYLCGPISGDMENYRENFRLARRLVEAAGYTPVSSDFLPLGLKESDYMRVSLSILEAADRVVTLRNWTASVGAQIEVAYAKKIGKPVESLLQFCKRNNVLATAADEAERGDAVSKNKKRERKPKAAPAPGMTIDGILAQLSSMKDNAASFLEPEPADPEGDAIWRADVDACEAATAILSVLQDAGIGDAEQVKDLIHDYNGLAQQYQTMQQRYEARAKPERLGDKYLCPACHRIVRGYHDNYCWFCGKRLEVR